MRRRTLIRLLVGLGIGIPILVEGITFLGLLESRLADGGDDGSSETPTPTPERSVGVGDEVLPETPQVETLTTATLAAPGGKWVLTLSVQVRNTGERPYALRLREVTLANGDAVDGRAVTGRIPPGESATATGQWSIPAGTTPEQVRVVGLTYADGTVASRVERRVRLAPIPVRG